MKDTVKKVMNLRFDRYEELERKLEKLAAQGLVLESCGSFFWTFRRGEPQRLHYTVTYFSEGSIFAPGPTENQQTYFEYAKAAGWDFVAQVNQMQIFCSKDEHPVPFETDEKEKLRNIKRCMKKTFVPSLLSMIFVFVLNLLVQFYSFSTDPIDFLSDPLRLCSCFTFAMVLLYEGYILLSYLIWCKRSERSVARGEKCIVSSGTADKIIQFTFAGIIFTAVGISLILLASKVSKAAFLLSVLPMPVLMILFGLSTRSLKKKKMSATVNRVVSIGVLLLADVAYLLLIFLCVMKFGIGRTDDTVYRTVSWPIGAENPYKYSLYRDEIPLTCADLYGPISYDYYSFQAETSRTVFLSKSSYRQDSLPARDAPPQIEYEVLAPGFDFVTELVEKELLIIPEWRRETRFQLIGNEIFGTRQAYQRYFEDSPSGEYLLMFQDQILVLKLEEPPTAEQIAVIKEKLQL